MGCNVVLDRSVAPPVTGFGTLEIPSAVTVALPSGATLHVLRQGQLDVCRLTCLIPGGMAEAGIAVLPQMLMSMLQEGTTCHPGAVLAQTVEFNGATIQIGVYQHYMLIAINMLCSKAYEVIPLLREMLFSPELHEVPFVACRERQVRNIELMEKRVEYQAARRMARQIMGAGHPLARTSEPGQVAGVTLSQLVEWYRLTCGSPRGMHLFLTGNVSDSMTALVSRLFGDGDGESGPLPFNIVPFCPQPPSRVHVTVPDALQSAVRISAPSIARSNPDYLDLRLLIMAIGGYFGSRLMMNIREDKGYTYGISASLNGRPEGSSVDIMTSTDTANVEPLVDEVFREIRRAARQPFSVDETDRLKSYAASQLASMLDTPFDIMDYHITLRAAFIGTDDYFKCQLHAINEITPARLGELASRYLSADDFSIVVAG